MDTSRLLFVSHSHQDDPFCLRLIADLRANLGEDAVWYDTSGGLQGGNDWWNRIIAEITERPYFLVVLSPHAWESKWVPEEMGIAYRQKVELGKRLLPVRLADSPRREDWKGVQEFDFTQSDNPVRYAAALADLLHAIIPTLTDPVMSAPSASPAPAEPERQLSPTERLAQETHTAYGLEHWSDVLDKTQILIERNAMTPVLWRERASAAFAIGDNNGGLAVIKQALTAGVDDTDTLLLYVRLTAKAGDDNQAVEILTRAYALASLNDIATRLTILDGLTAALARLGRWYDFARRVGDARRMAPDDPRWGLREIEALLIAQRYDESVAAARALPMLPAGMDATLVLPAWRSAISSAAMGLWDSKNWLTYRALFEAAARVGVDPIAIARWRFEFPHFMPLVTLSGEQVSPGSTVWSPNGALLAIASVFGVQVWDTTSRRLLGTLSVARIMPGAASGVVWSPDSTQLAIGGGGVGRIWDVASGQLLVTLGSQAHTGVKRMLAGANSISGYSTSLTILAWSPNGRWLAATSNAGDQIWDTASGRLLTTLNVTGSTNYAPYGYVSPTSVAWSPDGTRLVTSKSDSVRVWDAASGRPLGAHSGGHNPVAWSPDGTRLVTASADGIQIWDALNGRSLFTLANHLKEVKVLAWSPDGTRLVVCGESKGQNLDSARIYDAASGREIAILAGYGNAIHGVLWSPDGRRLVGYVFNLPVMWDAASGQEIGKIGSNFVGDSNTNFSGSWSPDGARLPVIDTKANALIIWGEE